MKFTSALVNYKGEEIEGLILSKNIQRITKEETPKNYVCIGKQQFGTGLRICFIHEIDYNEIKSKKSIKQDINKFSLLGATERLITKTRECYDKDSSEKHLNWFLKIAKNNLLFNNDHELAEKIVLNNWRKI